MTGWSGEGLWLTLPLVSKNHFSSSDVLVGQLQSTPYQHIAHLANHRYILCLRGCYEYTRQCDSLDFALMGKVDDP